MFNSDAWKTWVIVAVFEERAENNDLCVLTSQYGECMHSVFTAYTIIIAYTRNRDCKEMSSAYAYTKSSLSPNLDSGPGSYVDIMATERAQKACETLLALLSAKDAPAVAARMKTNQTFNAIKTSCAASVASEIAANKIKLELENAKLDAEYAAAVAQVKIALGRQ